VCDDLENDEIVMNKERREKFRRWFSATLMPCRSKDGTIRVIGTILHQDAMLERLMPHEGRKGVISTDLKVYYAPNHSRVWKAAKYRAHDKHFTKSLWPEHKPVEWLKEERQTYIDQGMLDVWSQEMLNEPLDEENAPFRRGDFKDMEEGDHQSHGLYYIASDLALSLEQQRDYCAFVVGKIDSSGRLSVPHVIHSRMQSDEIEETVFQLNDSYKPEMFFFEKGQIFLGLQPHLINGMVIRGQYFNLEAFASITDKLTRSSSIRARMRVGAVRFDKKADWYPDFEDECLKFPRGAHDDQVDALSLLGRGLNRFAEAPSDKELMEEAYEEELRESGSYEQGRSSITGY
jgi:predicted phage terminase large subunit-like protein